MPTVTKINNKLTIQIRKYSLPEPLNSIGYVCALPKGAGALSAVLPCRMGATGLLRPVLPNVNTIVLCPSLCSAQRNV